MALSLLAVGVLVILAAGYLLYGSFIARRYRLDDAHTTPATAINDGVDFIPTRPFYLLSQHFSAIAAAGPIAGPIVACMAFGWLPCLLWIVIGVIFIGAVHDFSALIASVRHGAHSIADVAKANLGKRAYLALVAFIWLALLYVIVAFTQITAQTFAGRSEEFAGRDAPFNTGGAVAASSTLYLLLALVMGLVTRLFRPPIWVLTIVFVPLTLVCVWAGTRLDGVLNLPAAAWCGPILAYCFVASLLPMWVLQQPRGYLGGFVLYMALGVGVLGLLVAGLGGDVAIRQPMLTDAAWSSLNPLAALDLFSTTPGVSVGGLLIPFLFVTIACGACSGFHGLICGGTTSKQIAKESHCKPIGFGAMLLEGFVAVIALATIMMLTREQSAGKTPGQIYGDGLATFLSTLVSTPAGWLGVAVDSKALFVFAATFGAMAFSTFIFDTLDVSTRLGRYLLQELVGVRSRAAGVLAAGATAGVPFAMLTLADPESYRVFWTLFGTSNQLLAALTLLGVAVWLKRQGRPAWYVLWPMAFVGTITVWALTLQMGVGIRDALRGAWRTPSGSINPAVLNAPAALALLLLAGFIAAQGWRAWRRSSGAPAPPPPPAGV